MRDTAIRTLKPAVDDIALLRLLQLASPALPVGAYAWSQGLETAVERGWVTDETTSERWIRGLLQHSLGYLDVPVLARLHRAWTLGDKSQVAHWNAFLFAAREAAELQQEDRHLGAALIRLLHDLGIERAKPWRVAPRVCFATAFSLAATSWDIPLRETVMGYLWTWTENQVAAATKLVPLGQTAGQRILSRAAPPIVAVTNQGMTLADDDIGCALPGLGIAGALHETQYSRLFRS